jgi:hypothetical protein
VRATKKKTPASRNSLLKLGRKVVLEKVPPGLLDGLPGEDQRAIAAIVGVPVRLSGFDDGRLELEFVEENGTIHTIYVDRKYVRAIKPAHRKIIRRK